jgi:hypothetical protein
MVSHAFVIRYVYNFQTGPKPLKKEFIVHIRNKGGCPAKKARSKHMKDAVQTSTKRNTIHATQICKVYCMRRLWVRALDFLLILLISMPNQTAVRMVCTRLPMSEDIDAPSTLLLPLTRRLVVFPLALALLLPPLLHFLNSHFCQLLSVHALQDVLLAGLSVAYENDEAGGRVAGNGAAQNDGGESHRADFVIYAPGAGTKGDLEDGMEIQQYDDSN